MAVTRRRKGRFVHRLSRLKAARDQDMPPQSGKPGTKATCSVCHAFAAVCRSIPAQTAQHYQPVYTAFGCQNTYRCTL